MSAHEKIREEGRKEEVELREVEEEEVREEEGVRGGETQKEKRGDGGRKIRC